MNKIYVRYEQKMDAQAWLHLQSLPHHFWIVLTTWISVHEINNYPRTLVSSIPQSQLQFSRV